MADEMMRSLQQWYASNCNGDWEHEFGLQITTLDNPGWKVVIDLEDTELAERSMVEVRAQISEEDWYVCSVRDQKFQGRGGAANLSAIIATFLAFAGSERA